MTKTANRKTLTTKLTVTAMLTAVAVVLQYIEVSIPIVPSFLKLDFSDLPELIGAFVIGPLWGVVICLLKNLIHLPFTSSVGVGEFSNFILGAIFVFVAGIIYKYHKTKKGALIALLCGVVAWGLIMMPANLIITPIFTGMPVEAIRGILLPIILPFNLIKAGINAVVTFLVYKSVSPLLHR